MRPAFFVLLLAALTGCYESHASTTQFPAASEVGVDGGSPSKPMDPIGVTRPFIPGESNSSTSNVPPRDTTDGGVDPSEEPPVIGVCNVSTDPGCGGSECEPDAGPCIVTGSIDGAYCDGPFEKRPSSDGCDAVSSRWDTRENVPTLEACFVLCADSPLCRENAFVNYHPGRKSCILNASCSPEPLGYNEYVARGGCGAPKQCFSWNERADATKCGGEPSGFGYFETASMEACILQCEKYPRVCGDMNTVDFDPATGNCMTERPNKCVLSSRGFVGYEYREVPCE